MKKLLEQYEIKLRERKNLNKNIIFFKENFSLFYLCDKNYNFYKEEIKEIKIENEFDINKTKIQNKILTVQNSVLNQRIKNLESKLNENENNLINNENNLENNFNENENFNNNFNNNNNNFEIENDLTFK